MVVARRTVTDPRRTPASASTLPKASFAPTIGRRRLVGSVEREAPRLAGGEGAALRAYSDGEGSHRRLGTDLEGSRRRADKHLPDIAGLIDPEQFALITRPSAGFVVIRGTAGSGKTTVALHRIAYLAYDDPSIDSERTLFVVFSPALRNYVSHVLPALGVERVQVQTLPRMGRRALPPALSRSCPARQRETTPGGGASPEAAPRAARWRSRSRSKRVAGQGDAAAGDRRLGQRADAAGAARRGRSRDEAPDAFSDRRAAARHRLESRSATRSCSLGCAASRSPQAELDAEDDAILLRAWQLRIGPHPRRAGERTAALPPHRHRRGAGLLAARGARARSTVSTSSAASPSPATRSST